MHTHININPSSVSRTSSAKEKLRGGKIRGQWYRMRRFPFTNSTLLMNFSEEQMVKDFLDPHNLDVDPPAENPPNPPSPTNAQYQSWMVKMVTALTKNSRYSVHAAFLASNARDATRAMELRMTDYDVSDSISINTQ